MKRKTKTITVHTIVKNEEQWIWYALMAAVNFADKIFVFDTGSTDKTAQLIKAINSPKIIFEQKGEVNAQGLTKLRQEQLERTETDWFWLVDGDEVWPQQASRTVLAVIGRVSSKTWGLVVRSRNCVGDVWHYQPESAGRYSLLGKKGHFNIRIYRKLPDFSWKGEYPDEVYCNDKGGLIHDQQEHLRFVNVAYWHLKHLSRSSKPKGLMNRQKKPKLELGIKAAKEELPEVFFTNKPSCVPSCMTTLSSLEKIKAAIVTPIRAIKRTIEQ